MLAISFILSCAFEGIPATHSDRYCSPLVVFCEMSIENQNRSRRERWLYWNPCERLWLDSGAEKSRHKFKKQEKKKPSNLWRNPDILLCGLNKSRAVLSAVISAMRPIGLNAGENCSSLLSYPLLSFSLSSLLSSPLARWMMSNQQHLFSYHQERSHCTTSDAVFRPLSALMHTFPSGT